MIPNSQYPYVNRWRTSDPYVAPRNPGSRLRADSDAMATGHTRVSEIDRRRNSSSTPRVRAMPSRSGRRTGWRATWHTGFEPKKSRGDGRSRRGSTPQRARDSVPSTSRAPWPSWSGPAARTAPRRPWRSAGVGARGSGRSASRYRRIPIPAHPPDCDVAAAREPGLPADQTSQVDPQASPPVRWSATAAFASLLLLHAWAPFSTAQVGLESDRSTRRRCRHCCRPRLPARRRGRNLEACQLGWPVCLRPRRLSGDRHPPVGCLGQPSP